MMGERWALPAGMAVPVMSVTHNRLGPTAWKSRATWFLQGRADPAAAGTAAARGPGWILLYPQRRWPSSNASWISANTGAFPSGPAKAHSWQWTLGGGPGLRQHRHAPAGAFMHAAHRDRPLPCRRVFRVRAPVFSRQRLRGLRGVDLHLQILDLHPQRFGVGRRIRPRNRAFSPRRRSVPPSRPSSAPPLTSLGFPMPLSRIPVAVSRLSVSRRSHHARQDRPPPAVTPTHRRPWPGLFIIVLIGA